MGRPRKLNVVRDTRGRSTGVEKDAKVVALAYRAREVGKENADNCLAGFPLGRLWLAGKITNDQLDTGAWYAGLIRKHAAIMGYQIGTVRSPGFEMVSFGTACAVEPDEKTILSVKQAFKDSYAALVSKGIRVATTTYDICLDRVEISSIGPDDVSVLQIGLNILGDRRK